MVTIFLYVLPALPDLRQPRAAYCSCIAVLAWQVTVQTKDQHLGCAVHQLVEIPESKSAIDLLSLESRCSASSAKHWNFPDDHRHLCLGTLLPPLNAV